MSRAILAPTSVARPKRPCVGNALNGPGRSGTLRLFLWAAIVLPVLVVSVGAWISWRQVWRESEAELSRAADALAEHARRVFDGLVLRIERANDLLAGLTDGEILSRENELHEDLIRVAAGGLAGAAQRPPYLFAYGRDSRPLVSSNIFPVPRERVFDNREFNVALRGPDAPDSFVSSVYVGTVTREAFFALTRRRERTGNGLPPGTYDGIINASVYVADASAALRRLAGEHGDVLALIRADGAVLARSAGAVGPSSRISEGSGMLAAMRRGQDRGLNIAPSTLDGIDRVAAYRRVEGYPVYASAARSRQEIVRRWREAVLFQLGTAVPAALALISLAFLVSRGQRALADANDRLEERVQERTRALATSEARLRELLATLDLTAAMARDLDGTIRFWSAGCERIYGWTAEEAVGRMAHDLLATRFPTSQADVEATLARDGEWQGDLRQRRRDGAEITVSAHKSLRRDSESQPIAVAESLTDVTELRRAEERHALLTREVDHRAKNALAVALTMVRMTPRDDAERFAASVEGRVAAMARAHSLLATEGWSGADLRTLVEGELAAFLERAQISGPATRLTPEAVQPVAMVLHELTTNAAKHGALAAEKGTIAVSWGAESESSLTLRWEERGGPRLSGPPMRPGFGTTLMSSIVGQQLGGTLEWTWAEQGLSVIISLGEHLVELGAAPQPVLSTSSTTQGLAVAMKADSDRPVMPQPRVLVVEDDVILAMELTQTLGALGYQVVGPARRLTDAVRLASSEGELHAAVLDVNLAGELSFPLVDLLQTRGVPYVFATGYGSSGSLEGRDRNAVAVLRKPYPKQALARALQAAIGSRHEGAASGPRM
ncbi:MAG TPA: HWE histidine kinase domain-containing protein [Salinarimonas sp.]|nr:HWE histidine kinase domain-containing protein [Salinarimonas sp.]